MQFRILLAVVASLYLPSVLAVTLAYDRAYDNESGSLDSVACSDGKNGLLTKGYTTYGSLPRFPNVGAAAAVEGYDSVNCGTCWNVTYNDHPGGPYSITVLAIDHAGVGFNIALEAMDDLTGGQGEQLGRVDVDAEQVDASQCGL